MLKEINLQVVSAAARLLAKAKELEPLAPMMPDGAQLLSDIAIVCNAVLKE
jgi:hypothetical protein